MHTMRMKVPKSSATNSFVDHPEKRRAMPLLPMLEESSNMDVRLSLASPSVSLFLSLSMTMRTVVDSCSLTGSELAESRLKKHFLSLSPTTSDSRIVNYHVQVQQDLLSYLCRCIPWHSEKRRSRISRGYERYHRLDPDWRNNKSPNKSDHEC